MNIYYSAKMKTIGIRIEARRIELKLKKTNIWKGSGLTSGVYAQWMNGAGLKGETLINVARILKVRPAWLESGKGQKELYDNNIEIPENSYLINKNISRVPIVGRAMGGLPDRLFTDEGRSINGHDEYADVYSSDKLAFATKVEGNSMYPKYVHGDYALIEPSTDPELEDDVILKLKSGEVMLKRLMSRRGGVHLASYNEPQTYIYEPDDILWLYYVAYPIPSRKIKNRL